MGIRLIDLSEEPIAIEQQLEPSWLNQVLDDAGHPTGFRTLVSQTIEGTARRVGLDVLILANGVLQLQTECSNCLTPFMIGVPVSFNVTLKPKPQEIKQLPEEVELTPNDLEEAYYQGDTIELLDLVREYLILSLPMHPKCSPECRGLCPVCGNDLNHAQCLCQRGEADPRWQVLKTLIQK